MSRKVLMAVKLMPASPDIEMDMIKKQVEQIALELGDLKDMKEEPIAFGLKALKVLLMVEDQERIAEKVEEKLSNLHGIESVEVESVTLI